MLAGMTAPPMPDVPSCLYISSLVQLMKAPLEPPTLKQQLAALGLGVASLLLLAGADTVSGPNIHIGVLYWVPVAFAAWYGGRWPAYVLIVSAIALWRRFSEPASDFDPTLEGRMQVQLWNLSIRAVYYPAVAEVVIFVRNTERRLERLVSARTTELRAENTERERAQAGQRKLAAQLSEAEDAERRRVAYDIHDALSQMLTLVKLNLETAVAESPTDSRQYERLSDVVKVVNDLIRQTRELTFDLHPAMLDDLGLVPTLRRFAEEFHHRTMAEVTVSEAGVSPKLPAALASYLFRSVKEVVNNAVKHGNAREIIVTLHWLAGGVRIVVDDDGNGFDPATVFKPSNGHRGLGLAGIGERLTSLGGVLRLESQQGQGARIILETPIQSPVTAVP